MITIFVSKHKSLSSNVWSVCFWIGRMTCILESILLAFNWYYSEAGALGKLYNLCYGFLNNDLLHIFLSCWNVIFISLQDLLFLACSHPENRSNLTNMEEWPEWILEVLISNYEVLLSRVWNGSRLVVYHYFPFICQCNEKLPLLMATASLLSKVRLQILTLPRPCNAGASCTELLFFSFISLFIYLFI